MASNGTPSKSTSAVQEMHPMTGYETRPDEGVEFPTAQGRSPPATFSDAIDAIGMGPFQKRLILMCGMGWLIDAMEILVVAFVLESIAITFHLNSVQKGLIGSASFFGMLIGAGFWTVYADKRGRRNAFVLSLTCVFVGGVASAAAPSLATLCVCRVIVGFGVGGNLPVATALVAEFLPTAHRAGAVCRISGTFWGFGVISASVLGLILANIFGTGHEEAMWRWFLGFAAIPSAVVAVAYRLLPESPRFLSVMGRHEEAAQVLELVARVNGKLDVLGLDFAGQFDEGDSLQIGAVPSSFDPTALRDGIPLTSTVDASNHQHVKGATRTNDVAAALAALRDAETVVPGIGYTHREEEQSVHAGDVRQLFHSPILRTVTLCLWVVWLFMNLSYYGLTFVLPRYYHEIFGGRENFVYVLTALLGVSFIPGAYTAVWFCSEQRLGRVGGLMYSSYATAASILLLSFSTHLPVLFALLSLVTLFFSAVGGTILYVITPELYSTKYRAVGMGSCSVVTRVGGLVAPVLAEVMYDKGGKIAPLLILGPMMIITAIFAGMIPVETAGRKLDDDSWDRRGPIVVDGLDDSGGGAFSDTTGVNS